MEGNLFQIFNNENILIISWFYSTKPFTFGAQVVKPQEPEDSEGKDDEDEEPPKVEFKPVIEEGAIYEQRYHIKYFLTNIKKNALI